MGGSGGGSRSFGRPSQPDGGQQPKLPSDTGGGGGGGGGEQPDDCSGIDVSVTLQSPQPAVVAALRKGDLLRVQLTNGAPPILAVTQAGATAGAIIPPDIKKLVDCLNRGHKFVAEVLQVTGGAVKVRVYMEQH